ncbi:hypothetical protein HK405_002556 [Cladochytrium tenue]|nr:hypothetical protein HK405_002556 [Cladochytrium tenue]
MIDTVSLLVDEKTSAFVEAVDGAPGATTTPASPSLSASRPGSVIGGGGGGVASAARGVAAAAAAAAAAASGLVRSAAAPPHHAASVRFMERRARRNNYWFAVRAEEQWTVRVTVTRARSEKEQIHAQRAAEAGLSAALSKVARASNENKDHIPPVTTVDGYPFPFQITVNTAADAASSGWGGLMKGLEPVKILPSW